MNLAGRSHDSYYISILFLSWSAHITQPFKRQKMRKGQSIVVHHTGNYYTASCKMVFWLPGHLVAWAVWPSGPYLPVCGGLTYYARQKKLLSGPPLPAVVHHKLLVVETLKLYSKRTEIIVALYSGPTGEEKKHFNPCRPRKKSKMMRNPPIKWENVFLLQKNVG